MFLRFMRKSFMHLFLLTSLSSAIVISLLTSNLEYGLLFLLDRIFVWYSLLRLSLVIQTFSISFVLGFILLVSFRGEVYLALNALGFQRVARCWVLGRWRKLLPFLLLFLNGLLICIYLKIIFKLMKNTFYYCLSKSS